jgi:RNA polymerase sigma factor (sigma-70 family)
MFNDSDLLGIPIENLDETTQDSIDAVDAVDAKDALDKVRAWMTQLPKREQHVMKQIYFEDRTPSEIGRDMGFSRQYIDSLRNKAIKRLRDYV